MRKSVVDCSLVAAFLLGEPKGDSLDSLYQDHLEGRIELVVPSLFWYEITNVLIIAQRKGRIDAELREQATSDLEDMFLTTDAQDVDRARRQIERLGLQHDLSAYDAAYLELALRLGASLHSLDDDLLDLASDYPETIMVRHEL